MILLTLHNNTRRQALSPPPDNCFDTEEHTRHVQKLIKHLILKLGMLGWNRLELGS